ncbi:hypothetical protein N9O88_00285 [bacterium]|nr:hypothetical protein [bacterium]
MAESQNLHLPGSYWGGKTNSKYEGDLIQVIGKDNYNYPPEVKEGHVVYKLLDVVNGDKKEINGIFIKNLDTFYLEFYHKFG